MSQELLQEIRDAIELAKRVSADEAPIILERIQARLRRAPDPRDEVIELCRVALEESRDDVCEALSNLKECAGYPAFDRMIKRQEQQLERHDEALAAIKALERGK